MNTSVTLVKTTDSDRLRAFQIQAAAARQAAGFKPKVPKTENISAPIEALYTFDELRHMYLHELPDERKAFWQQLYLRQDCWEQAVETFENYRATGTLEYLQVCQGQAAAAGSERQLDKVEARLGGGKLTTGPFAMRKQFWVFVGYKLRGITPRDLTFLADVHHQLRLEADTRYEEKIRLERAAA